MTTVSRAFFGNLHKESASIIFYRILVGRFTEASAEVEF